MDVGIISGKLCQTVPRPALASPLNDQQPAPARYNAHTYAALDTCAFWLLPIPILHIHRPHSLTVSYKLPTTALLMPGALASSLVSSRARLTGPDYLGIPPPQGCTAI